MNAPALDLGLVLGLGAVLVLDSTLRLQSPESLALLSGDVGPAAFATLLHVQRTLGCLLAALPVLPARLQSGSLRSALCLGGAFISRAIFHIEPRCYCGGDNLLRWCLAFGALLPARRAAALAVVALYGGMYGGSLFWKDATAYLVEGHPPRSMLLDPHFGAFVPKRLWEPAIALACSPLGPWLGRAVYVGEFLASVPALLVVLLEVVAPREPWPALRARSHSAMGAVVLAMAPLHLGLAATTYLGTFPYVSLLLHLAAWSAATELSARPAPPLTRGGKAALVALLVYVAVLCGMMASGVQAGGRSRFSLHVRFDMFPYRSDAPLVVGRLITYAVGETAAGDEFEIDLDHLGQRAYAPGEGDFRTDSARPVADPLLWADSRWRKFAETLWNGRAEYAEHDARQMCARAERLWRAGKLPGPPDLVAMYRVEYDLPRANGAAAVAVEANRLELIRLTNASGAPLSATGWSSELGEWGGFPRVVVAVGLAEWSCKKGRAVEDEPLIYAFAQPRRAGNELGALDDAEEDANPRGASSVEG